MADAADLKSAAREGVRVRVPPSAQAPADRWRTYHPAMADRDGETRRGVAHAVLWEFAKACERDPELGADYLDVRAQWHGAASEQERDIADEAYVDVLERFTDARGAALTDDEVRAMRALRSQ